MEIIWFSAGIFATVAAYFGGRLYADLAERQDVERLRRLEELQRLKRQRNG